jgi:hypothetical protein
LDETSGVTVLTPWVSNLTFRSVDPGGYGSVTFDLSRKIDARDFEDQADVFIYNGETGQQVSGGRLQNPGRGASRSGEVWQMEVLGEGPAHMQERKEPYIIEDNRITPWFPSRADLETIAWAQGGPPDTTAAGGVGGTNGLVFTMEDGASVPSGNIAEITYYDIGEFPDAIIGGYAFAHVEGRADTNSHIKSSVDAFATTDEDDTFSLSEQFVAEDVASVASPKTELVIRYQRASTTRTATTKDWSYIHELTVFAMRYDKTRTLIDTGTTYLRTDGLDTNFPTTTDVVTDLWARFCPRVDLANARIDGPGLVYFFVDLVWPNGVTPAEVLAFLKQKDPGYTWAVWERQPNGLFRAEWRAYDTDVRYELTAEDGFTETSASTKYVKIFGVSTDSVTTHRYQGFSYDDPDPTLAARGINPSTTIVDAIGGDDELIGLLDEKELEAGTAQATVARKVFDHFTGRWVEPYNVLPGYLCRIAGVPPREDALNVGQVDGACIFKIVSNEFSTSSASSRLELNAYTVDERRAIANLLAAQR